MGSNFKVFKTAQAWNVGIKVKNLAALTAEEMTVNIGAAVKPCLLVLDGNHLGDTRFAKEPERVVQKAEKYFNAYRMAIKLGDKTVAKKLKTLAQNGEEEAKSILEEFGI